MPNEEDDFSAEDTRTTSNEIKVVRAAIASLLPATILIALEFLRRSPATGLPFLLQTYSPSGFVFGLAFGAVMLARRGGQPSNRLSTILCFALVAVFGNMASAVVLLLLRLGIGVFFLRDAVVALILGIGARNILHLPLRSASLIRIFAVGAICTSLAFAVPPLVTRDLPSIAALYSFMNALWYLPVGVFIAWEAQRALASGTPFREEQSPTAPLSPARKLAYALLVPLLGEIVLAALSLSSYDGQCYPWLNDSPWKCSAIEYVSQDLFGIAGIFIQGAAVAWIGLALLLVRSRPPEQSRSAARALFAAAFVAAIASAGALAFVLFSRTSTLGKSSTDIALLLRQLAGGECLIESPAAARALTPAGFSPFRHPDAPDAPPSCGQRSSLLLQFAPIGCRAHALRCLGELRANASAAVDPIVSALQDVDADHFDFLGYRTGDMRREAVLALGRIGGAKALEAVRRALEDPEEPVRIEALRALYRNDALPELSGTQIKQLIRLADETGKIEIAAALARINTPDALAELSGLANDRDPQVRRAAIRALGEARQSDAVKILAALLKDRESAAAAIEALGTAGKRGTDVSEYLLPALAAPRSTPSAVSAQLKALTVLASLPGKAEVLVPAALPLLDAANTAVQKAAADLVLSCTESGQFPDVRTKAATISARFTRLPAGGELLKALQAITTHATDNRGIEAAVNLKTFQRTGTGPSAISTETAAGEIEFQPPNLRRMSLEFSGAPMRRQLEISNQHSRVFVQWPFSEGVWGTPAVEKTLYREDLVADTSPATSLQKSCCSNSSTLLPLDALFENGMYVSRLTLDRTETADGVECYVLTDSDGSTERVFWVGMNDGVIRRTQTRITGSGDKLDADLPFVTQETEYSRIKVVDSFPAADFEYTPPPGAPVRVSVVHSNGVAYSAD